MYIVVVVVASSPLLRLRDLARARAQSARFCTCIAVIVVVVVVVVVPARASKKVETRNEEARAHCAAGDRAPTREQVTSLRVGPVQSAAGSYVGAGHGRSTVHQARRAER